MTNVNLELLKQTIDLLDRLQLKGFKLSGPPSAITEASKVLKISRGSVYSRIVSAANNGIVPKVIEDKPIVEHTPLRIAPSADDLTMQERQRYSDTVDRLRAELRAAHRALNAGDSLKQAVFKLKDADIKPPRWLVSAHSKKEPEEIPILFTSDIHLGEVVVSEQVNGINEYSVDIAKRRYKSVIERTIKVCRRTNQKYLGIMYVRGGDAISGDIHDELRKTNELTSINQCIALVEMEIAGIRALADEFSHVWVVSVCGNHGRQTEKPEYKNYTDSNYDYLTAYMIQQQLASDKRISFYAPKGPDAIVNIYGWTIVFTHGNQLSGKGGGTGFIGPSATINKGVFKLRQSYAQAGIFVDLVVLGHFHTSLLGGPHYIANTSLIGYGEFSQSLRVEPEAPGATLFFVDSQVGPAGRTVIYAESPVKHNSPQATLLSAFK